MTDTSGFSTAADSQVQDTSSQGQEFTAEESFQQPTQQESASSGGNPAWQPILDKLPAGLHEMIRPELENWDRGVQEKFQQVQSRYAPFKDFVENGVSPEDIQRAMQVYSLLNNNPRALYDHMGQYYKFAQEQAAASGDQGQQEFDEYDLDDPEGKNSDTAGIAPEKFEQLERQQQIIAQVLYQEYQRKQQEAADAELEQELARLREEHGDFDEEFVIAVAAQTGDLPGAVAKYNEIISRKVGAPRPGSDLPRVMTPGSSTPSTQVNPAELDSKGTRELIVEMLKAQRNG